MHSEDTGGAYRGVFSFSLLRSDAYEGRKRLHHWAMEFCFLQWKERWLLHEEEFAFTAFVEEGTIILRRDAAVHGILHFIPPSCSIRACQFAKADFDSGFVEFFWF
jgi:hypothetical protein